MLVSVMWNIISQSKFFPEKKIMYSLCSTLGVDKELFYYWKYASMNKTQLVCAWLDYYYYYHQLLKLIIEVQFCCSY